MSITFPTFHSIIEPKEYGLFITDDCLLSIFSQFSITEFSSSQLALTSHQFYFVSKKFVRLTAQQIDQFIQKQVEQILKFYTTDPVFRLPNFLDYFLNLGLTHTERNFSFDFSIFYEAPISHLINKQESYFFIFQSHFGKAVIKDERVLNLTEKWTFEKIEGEGKGVWSFSSTFQTHANSTDEIKKICEKCTETFNTHFKS